VVREGKLIAGNFSEPTTTAFIADRPIKTQARRVEGGDRLTGRKMFASMKLGCPQDARYAQQVGH